MSGEGSGPRPADSIEDSWTGLPPRLRALGDLTGSGELLWAGDLAREVIAWIVEEGRGLIGGEIYVGVGKARGAFAGEWQTTPQWLADEQWQVFVERGAAQARAEIGVTEASSAESSTRRFFLAAASQAAYPAYLRGT